MSTEEPEQEQGQEPAAAPKKTPAGARAAAGARGARRGGVRGGGKASAAGAAPAREASGGSQEQAQPKLVMRKFCPVYLSVSNLNNDTCIICRNLISDPCIHCQAANITDPSACVRQGGKCGHVFHLHCLERWLARNRTCPVCQESWEPENA